MTINFIKEFYLVLILALGSLFFLERGREKTSEAFQLLRVEQEELQEKIEIMKKNNANLQDTVNSFSSSTWQELMLKQHLGLVSEGEKKVFFSPKEDS